MQKRRRPTFLIILLAAIGFLSLGAWESDFKVYSGPKAWKTNILTPHGGESEDIYDANLTCQEIAVGHPEPHTPEYFPTGKTVDISRTQWAFYKHNGNVSWEEFKKMTNPRNRNKIWMKILGGKLYYRISDIPKIYHRTKSFMVAVLLALDKYKIPDMEFMLDSRDLTRPPGDPAFKICGYNYTGSMPNGFTVPYPKEIQDLLGPTQMTVLLNCLNQRYPREERVEKVVWRGTVRTFAFDKGHPYALHPRQQVLLSGLNLLNYTDFEATRYVDDESQPGIVCEPWVNITKDGQCPEPREEIPGETYNNYAFVLDADGRGWSQRFVQLLLQNTPMLKQVSGFPDYLSQLAQQANVVEFIRTDMSDFEDKIKEVIAARSRNPLEYHDERVKKMQEFSRQHLTHSGIIRATAYALTVYAEKATWTPKMEEGFAQTLLEFLDLPQGIPLEVVERIRSMEKV